MRTRYKTYFAGTLYSFSEEVEDTDLSIGNESYTLDNDHDTSIQIANNHDNSEAFTDTEYSETTIRVTNQDGDEIDTNDIVDTQSSVFDWDF